MLWLVFLLPDPMQPLGPWSILGFGAPGVTGAALMGVVRTGPWGLPGLAAVTRMVIFFLLFFLLLVTVGGETRAAGGAGRALQAAEPGTGLAECTAEGS